MNLQEELHNLKKELVILRINKITKQKTENHKIKKIQHRIAQINYLENKTNEK
uniref:Ribosomal protein L29 n=1 Tax=Polysiphonia sertularioides TaxID=945028 RepID=A0A1Z1M9F7_9FLOR|nr:ribosomal protein L29 [Polysiphonia sertularioides]ARW62533.1 ribosomal protein L29 [Polysiphonia sertularioides]